MPPVLVQLTLLLAPALPMRPGPPGPQFTEERGMPTPEPVAVIEEGPGGAAGEHIFVRTDFGGDESASEALELAEAAWRLTGELVGPPRSARHPELRRMQLYRTESAYARAESDLTGGFFRGNLSFSHWKTRSSHIALQPPVGDEVLVAVGLPYQTRRLIAHEAAHLAVFDSLSNFRYHPFWFAEGLAQCVEARVVIERGLAESVEQDPFFSQYLAVGVDLAAEQDLPRLEMLLSDATADLDGHTRYALAWLLVEFLAEPRQRPVFDRIVRILSDLPPGPSLPTRLSESVTEELGAGTVRRLGDEFERWVAAREPRWRESARSLETAGEEWVHLGFPGRGGVAWSTQAVSAEGFTLHGTARLLNAGRGELSVLLARGAGGFLSIVLYAGGVVEVQAWESATGEWSRLAGWTVAGVDFSRPTPFRVVAADGVLEITLAGEAGRRVPVPGWDLAGAWGLGVGSGAAGAWTDVTLQPAEGAR